jgi:hypothetical protein
MKSWWDDPWQGVGRLLLMFLTFLAIIAILSLFMGAIYGCGSGGGGSSNGPVTTVPSK